MQSQLSIAQRLSLGFGLILSLMILITLIGVIRVGFIDETLTAVSEGASLKQRYAINFRGSVHDRAIAIRDVVLSASPAEQQKEVATIEDLARRALAELAEQRQDASAAAQAWKSLPVALATRRKINSPDRPGRVFCMQNGMQGMQIASCP